MGNNTSNNKFDDVVKDTLGKYEARNDAGDWSRMERMLDAAPKSVQFRWSYRMNIFIGIAVIVGGYLIYSAVSSDKTADVSEPVPAETPVISPVNTKVQTVTAPPEVLTDSSAKSVLSDVPPPPVSEISTSPVSQKNEKIVPANSIGKADDAQKSSDIKTDDAGHNNSQKIFGMGNEPVFGDMLDSSKGIVNETKEKDATKNAAKNTPAYPVGWNSIMLSNVNLDSLKKYREKKDTIN